MKKEQLIRILLTLIAVAASAAFARSSGFYLPAAASLYFALTLIGVTLICWRLTRSWRMVFWISPVIPWMACILTIGLVGFLYISAGAARTTPSSHANNGIESESLLIS